MPTVRARRWCFTRNNPPLGYDTLIRQLIERDDVLYVIFGREVAATGTPHFQGFIIFSGPKTRQFVSAVLPNSHLEPTRGTSAQAADYCKKEGDYEELGELPTSENSGQRGQFDIFKEWCIDLDHTPYEQEIAVNFPHLFCRYRRNLLDLAKHLRPRPAICQGELRPWQEEVTTMFDTEADDRKILFVVDPAGNMGKSWLCRFLISQRNDVQLLGIAKRDDMAHTIDVTKRIFVLNVPRNQMEYLNYGFLESLKDQMVFSPKYESQMKLIPHKVHVAVFSNEDPDYEKMTEDRYDVMQI